MDEATYDGLMERVENESVSQEDIATLGDICRSHYYVMRLIDHQELSIKRLKHLLFGASTEKTADVLERLETVAALSDIPTLPKKPTEDSQPASSSTSPTAQAKPRKPGHGRRAADDIKGAKRIAVRNKSFKPGDACPDCPEGILYELRQPGVLIRFIGQPPVAANVYDLQKLRCGLCGQVITADAPAEAMGEKYDPTAASMIAMLKYGSGLPFNRIENLQNNLDVPLPASTQWDIVKATANQIQPALDELIRQAAAGEVLYNDDTTVKILDKMGLKAKTKSEVPVEKPSADESVAATAGPSTDQNSNTKKKSDKERTGLFTSGVVATREQFRIALFLSGNQHAGENLADVLKHRSEDLSQPIQMCDALSRNYSEGLSTILSNCLVHARRNFVEVADNFKEECKYVLESLEVVYYADKLARERKLTADERLNFHQTESGPVMEELREWLKHQMEGKLVEKNSGLGSAIEYFRRHWEKLTVFLRVAGAPLDNNICERALKKAILHRKNSLFYKTQNGADVGDLYMSLIYTCEMNGINPLDYLTELQRHSAQLASNPSAWMPWNYQENLQSVVAAS